MCVCLLSDLKRNDYTPDKLTLQHDPSEGPSHSPPTGGATKEQRPSMRLMLWAARTHQHTLAGLALLKTVFALSGVAHDTRNKDTVRICVFCVCVRDFYDVMLRMSHLWTNEQMQLKDVLVSHISSCTIITGIVIF